MINYTVKQLYSYEALIRLASFTRAANELNITQPAIYMQIQQLENNLSTKLYDIAGKKVNPTYVGEIFYKNAKDIIDKLEITKQSVNELINPNTGHLKIAVATTANLFVSKLLVKFRKKHPKISFHLEVTNRRSLLDNLKNNVADLVIMGEPPNEDNIIYTKFMENPLIAIVHPKHHLLKLKSIDVSKLENEILISREQGSGTRNTIEKRIGLSLNSDFEMNSNEAIVQAVEAGLGIGFVSEHTVKLELEANKIKKLDIKGFPIMRYWYIVYNKNKYLSPIAKKFQAFVLLK